MHTCDTVLAQKLLFHETALLEVQKMPSLASALNRSHAGPFNLDQALERKVPWTPSQHLSVPWKPALPMSSAAHLPQSPASPSPQEKTSPGLPPLTAGVCLKGSIICSQFTHPIHTSHGMWKGAWMYPLCQEQTKIKKKKEEFRQDICPACTATFFFRSRDRLRCFFFFSVSSSALISKSLFFFSCEAAWAIMH